jgi:RecQ family ATP-dependent DNA helicase
MSQLKQQVQSSSVENLNVDVNIENKENLDDYEKSKLDTKRYDKLKKLLRDKFNHIYFKKRQYEIINNIINGYDVCAILPTGYGKSLTFQIPSLYLDKPTIVVSPLISLMDDQRLNLDKLGIKSCCFNSTVSNKTKLKNEILNNEYKIIYITPEAISSNKEFLIKLNTDLGLSLIAIDEAHCISTYGFDFRIAYRKLSTLREFLPNIPILALTATATTMVTKDLCNVLKLDDDVKIIKTSFDRPNLELNIMTKTKGNISKDIIPIVKKFVDKSIIIYCLTRKDTIKIAELVNKFGINCGVYHGGMENYDRKLIHTKFLNDEVKCIVATIAFGMGINKPDIRVVIHYGCPKNLESYYQEIGRAGRDSLESYCYLFYGMNDFKMQEIFIKNGTDEINKANNYRLLNIMKSYVMNKQCRRKMLLTYFNEKYDNICLKCDYCINLNNNNKIELTKVDENVTNESFTLINLISLIKEDREYKYFIEILRGGKIVKEEHKFPSYYNTSKRSIDWWTSLIQLLIKKSFLVEIKLKSNVINGVLKTTAKGTEWSYNMELNMFEGKKSNNDIIMETIY